MANLVKRMVVSFNYQSQEIHFNEWIELITLCLAPLIAHIIAGVPSPTFLNPKRPRWHERMGLVNPTSIIWRYFAIFDRRIRAKSWNALDMAASNAVFWTNKGWDGSEEMIRKSREYCLREPARTHIGFFSGTAAKTLIVTLQGFQAIYALLLGITSPKSNKYDDLVAFNYIFVPLAIFGLLRLPVAFWLAEDYSFANFNTRETSDTSTESLQENEQKRAITSETEYSTTGLLGLNSVAEEDSFHSANSWRGIAARAFFPTLLTPLLGITLYYLSHGRVYTTTTLLINLFYLMFLTGAILILLIYFSRGVSRTTIIPCVTSVWYKVYTGFLLAFIVVIMIIAGLETRKTPCGKYTTYSSDSDRRLCSELFNLTSH